MSEQECQMMQRHTQESNSEKDFPSGTMRIWTQRKPKREPSRPRTPEPWGKARSQGCQPGETPGSLPRATLGRECHSSFSGFSFVRGKDIYIQSRPTWRLWSTGIPQRDVPHTGKESEAQWSALNGYIHIHIHRCICVYIYIHGAPDDSLRYNRTISL